MDDFVLNLEVKVLKYRCHSEEQVQYAWGMHKLNKSTKYKGVFEIPAFSYDQMKVAILSVMALRD